MRPSNQAARDRLPTVMARLGPATAPALAQALAVSTATLRRMLAELGEEVCQAGLARRRRYALRRALRGQAEGLRLYALDASSGQPTVLARLTLTRPQGCHVDGALPSWPLPEGCQDGWWDGLPYMLQDLRPQGFMGRQFAQLHHQALELAPDPTRWSDDEALLALSRAGLDMPGNLVVGDIALARWQAHRARGLSPVSAGDLPAHYVRLAAQAVSTGVAGSSAAGEFPKFTAARQWPGARTPHVIVKFSGAGAAPAVQRWADLLVCEHLALDTLQSSAGLAVAASRIVQAGGRTFLESERFDRHGDWGRSPVVSLASINAAFLGAQHQDWPGLAVRLGALGLLNARCIDQLALLWWFGRLIGNSDMHTGNVCFVPMAGHLQLAPAYDMLPMMYAPLPGGELGQRPFEPAPPTRDHHSLWLLASEAAARFWARASDDPRISAAFRQTCAGNAAQLLTLRSSLG